MMLSIKNNDKTKGNYKDMMDPALLLKGIFAGAKAESINRKGLRRHIMKQGSSFWESDVFYAENKTLYLYIYDPDCPILHRDI